MRLAGVRKPLQREGVLNPLEMGRSAPCCSSPFHANIHSKVGHMLEKTLPTKQTPSIFSRYRTLHFSSKLLEMFWNHNSNGDINLLSDLETHSEKQFRSVDACILNYLDFQYLRLENEPRNQFRYYQVVTFGIRASSIAKQTIYIPYTFHIPSHATSMPYTFHI